MKERGNVLTTMELCEKLGVSRSWVNTHLRHLGSAPDFIGDGTRIRTVFYCEYDVVKWLNDHAVCHAQTKEVSLRDYATDAQIERVSSKVRASLERDKCPAHLIGDLVFASTIDALLPGDVAEEAERVDSRKRGDLPWVPVSRKISALDDLRSIKVIADGASPEIGYRRAFTLAMIRFEVDGRCWFVMPERDADDLLDRWTFLIPYPQR